MITYIISFILCSGLLLLAYHTFLSSEKLYRFNRFYLLFSLVFAVAVPFITIKAPAFKIAGLYNQPVNKTVSAINTTPVIQPEYQPLTEVNAPDQKDSPKITQQTNTITAIPIKQSDAPKTNYLPFLLPALYVAITLIMLLRFVRNGYNISRKVVKNTTLKYDEGTQLVLINEDVTPHSFLKYIFINRDDYNSGAIEPEIICHEQTHVRQLHSVDIIIIELLQIVCWFNPFIPFYRKAIQLNHEFLADEAVIESYDNTPAYQYLLLAKATQASSLNLTSQFNYRATKKRLLMMTKHTSAKIALYKKLAIVPFLAVAIFLFSQKSTAEILKVGAKTNITGAKPSIKKTAIISEKDKKFDSKFLAPSDSLDEAKAMQMIKKFPRFGGRVKHAEKDAPNEVVNAYKAILDKYDIHLMDDRGNGKLSDISSADTVQLHKLFSQMSIKQQDSQFVWFQRAFKPTPNKVTAAQLKLYSGDASKYGVWIDGKRIKNSTLKNYKAEDFSRYFFSRLMPNAIKYDEFKFQVNLTTNKAFDEEYKKAMADQGDKLTRVHARKNQLVIHNNELTDKSSFKFPPPIVNKDGPHVSYIKVVGEVVYPGLYASPKGNELAQELIKKAGGVTPEGSIENTQVFRAGKRVKIDFVSTDSKDVLLSGDSIVVPSRLQFLQGSKIIGLKGYKNFAVTKPAPKTATDDDEPMFVLPSPESAPAAKTDAPRSVLDEYVGILQRNHLPYKKGEPISIVPSFSKDDKARLLKLYEQMSDAQQKQQIIEFRYPYPPGGVAHITSKGMLALLKNNSDKQLWINGKKVNLDELEKMPDNIQLYSLGLILKNSHATNNWYYSTSRQELDYQVNTWVKNHISGFYIPNNIPDTN